VRRWHCNRERRTGRHRPLAHREDGFGGGATPGAPVKARWHGGHDDLHHDGELLQNLQTRRGGGRSESLTMSSGRGKIGRTTAYR
jgi:hypothetical protein